MRFEIARGYKLEKDGSVLPISFVLPRKTSGVFDESVYPPCFSGTTPMSADDWLSGENAEPTRVSLDPNSVVGSPRHEDYSPKISLSGKEHVAILPQSNDSSPAQELVKQESGPQTLLPADEDQNVLLLRIDELEADIARKSETIHGLEQTVTELQGKLSSFQDENAKLVGTIDSLRSESASASAATKERDTIAAEWRVAQRQLESISGERASLMAQWEVAQRGLAEMAEERQLTQRERARIAAEWNEAQRLLESITLQREGEQRETAIVKGEWLAAKRDLEMLAEERQQARKEREALEARLQDLTAKVAEGEQRSQATEEKIRELTESNDAKDTHIKRIMTDMTVKKSQTRHVSSDPLRPNVVVTS